MRIDLVAGSSAVVARSCQKARKRAQSATFRIGLGVAMMVAAGPSLGFADQIALGGGGTVTFDSTGAAGSNIALSPSPLTLSSGSSGTFESPTGTTLVALQPWSLVFPSNFQFGGLSSGQFTTFANNTGTSFSWGGSGGGTVTGTVIWTVVKDSTQKPNFVGTVTITGDTVTAGQYGGHGAAILADYAVGSVDSIDFTVNLGSDPSLDGVYAHTSCLTPLMVRLSLVSCSTQGTFSSGEVPSSAVPEPATLLLLGSGLISLGIAGRRRVHLSK
jgi:PEP-CTERM motif-containing protein